jgi:hypothetical protein
MATKDHVYSVRIHGSRLMMHNEQLANPFNEYTRALAIITHKRKKTEEDYWEAARVEFQGGLYHDDEHGPYVPGHCIVAMIVEGAKRRKLGTDFERSLLCEETINPLSYKGPRDRKGLWEAKDPSGAPAFADQRLVGIGQRRILRTRPLFRDWKLDFSLRALDGALMGQDIATALHAAQKIGLLDGRPQYAGQFTVESFDEMKVAA